MKRSYLYVVVIVVVIAAVAVWYKVDHKNTSYNNNTASMNMSSAHNSTSSQTPTSTDTVTIQNFAFSPSNITIKKGTTVTWTNKDSVAHTVTETDGQAGPKSGEVNPNASYTFTFSTPGTYHYHCSIHPDMTGTVTVTD